MYNESLKQNIYLWRERHREEYNAINLKYSLDWYARNKVKVCLKKKAQRCLKMEFLRLCKMFQATVL